MDIHKVAKKIGVDPICVEHFISGRATISIAGEFGVTKPALQDFIDGRVQESVSTILGMTRDELQELRNGLKRDEAIAMIIDRCLRKTQRRVA